MGWSQDNDPFAQLAAFMLGEGDVVPRGSKPRTDDARLDEVRSIADTMSAIVYSASAAANRASGEAQAYHNGRVVVLRECVRLLRGALDGSRETSDSQATRLLSIAAAHHPDDAGTCVECAKPSPCPSFTACQIG